MSPLTSQHDRRPDTLPLYSITVHVSHFVAVQEFTFQSGLFEWRVSGLASFSFPPPSYTVQSITLMIDGALLVDTCLNMRNLLSFCFLSLLPVPGLCYYDFGGPEKRIVVPQHPVPRPRQLPTNTTSRGPSLVTSSNTLGYTTLYTGAYRGLFAFEPLVVSCTPCGSSSVPSSSGTCTPLSYEGVFRSSQLNSRSSTINCFPSSYGGAFSTNSTSTTIPCCSSSSDVCRSSPSQ